LNSPASQVVRQVVKSLACGADVKEGAETLTCNEIWECALECDAGDFTTCLTTCDAGEFNVQANDLRACIYDDKCKVACAE